MSAIKTGRFIWLAKKAAGWVGLSIDREKKTWKIYSQPMFDPSTQIRNYEDIISLFKSNLEEFETHEERDQEGRLRKFSVSTPLR